MNAFLALAPLLYALSLGVLMAAGVGAFSYVAQHLLSVRRRARQRHSIYFGEGLR